MQGANNFKPTFLNEEGEPFKFYIWKCAEGRRIKELIEDRFGEVTEDPKGDYTIQLADPKRPVPGEVYSVYYIIECCSFGKLLDLKSYRINPTSKYGTSFCPMDVLQGHITWKEAEVFSLENERLRSKSSTEISIKRRKVSDTSSTDEELGIIDEISKRQSSNHLDRLCISDRGIGTARRKKRGLYTLREKEAIVQYLKAHKACNAIKGTIIWKKMEEKKVCADRTWQSMKEHFLKHILPTAEAFGFSTLEVKLLKKTTSSTTRKKIEKPNVASRDSDEDVVSFPGNRYTPEEDEAILKFISCDKRYLRAGGVTIWQRMERRRVVPGRSWQSLKERYRKNLVYRLDNYVNKDELNRMETWIKGSQKRCTCCAKSTSPASPAASGDTSFTSSSSSEMNSSDSAQSQRRKLFTNLGSPIIFASDSDKKHRIRVPVTSKLDKPTARSVQHKTVVVGKENCNGAMVTLVAKEKTLPSVDKTTRCVQNKEKTTITVQTVNDKQQINYSLSSPIKEGSVAEHTNVFGKKDVSAVSKSSFSANEGQKNISSTAFDAALDTLSSGHKLSAAEDENCSELDDSVNSSQDTLILELENASADIEPHLENSFDASDPQTRQSPSKEPDCSRDPKATADLSYSTAELGCSPEKREVLSRTSDISDKAQDGICSSKTNEGCCRESSIRASDDQPKKAKRQDMTCLGSLSGTDVPSLSHAPSSFVSSKQYKRKLFTQCNSPVVFTPILESETKSQLPEPELLAKNIQLFAAEKILKNTATANTNSESSKRHKKAIGNKPERHKGTTSVSKVERGASKVDEAARCPKESSKQKKVNAENDKGKDNLFSLDEAIEISSVRKFSANAAYNSDKNIFSSDISTNRDEVEDRNGVSETSGDQIIDMHAIPCCSKYTNTNYCVESNQETSTLTHENEANISNDHTVTSGKIKSKETSLSKNKKKSDGTDVRNKVKDKSRRRITEKDVKMNEEASLSKNKKKSYETDVRTKVKDKSRRRITEKDVKMNEEASLSKNKKKSYETDVRTKVKDKSRRITEKGLKMNEVTETTDSSNELNRDDTTILDMQEIIPKEINSESTKIQSEHTDAHTNRNEKINALLSLVDNETNSNLTPENIALNVFNAFMHQSKTLENNHLSRQNDKHSETEDISATASANDKSSEVVQLPNKDKGALENITCIAVQVCEISNSNANMCNTQETHTSVNSHSQNKSIQTQSSAIPGTISLSCKNTDLLLLKENLNYTSESVLCNESDDEAERRNMPQEASQCFGTAITETPDLTEDDADQESYCTPLSDQHSVSVSDNSCNIPDQHNLSCSLVSPATPSMVPESSQMFNRNLSNEFDGVSQEWVVGRIESVRSLANEHHSMDKKIIYETGKEMLKQHAGIEVSNRNEELQTSDETSLSSTGNQKAYMSFLNQLNDLEAENFNIIETVDKVVNTLFGLNSTNTVPKSEPATFVVEEAKFNQIHPDGQDPLHEVLNIKEEPASNSDIIEELRIHIQKEHAYCMRMEEIEVKEEYIEDLYDAFKF